MHYLIGNKIDLLCRVVSKEQAQAQVMARMIMDCHMKYNPKDNCFMLSSKSSEGENKRACYGGKKEKKNK